MSRDVFIGCSFLDGSKLPATLEVTKDPNQFDPTKPSSILAVRISPNARTTTGWHVLFGVDRAPSDSGGSLVKTALEPQVLPILVGGAAVLGGTSAEALFLTYGVPLMAATAVVLANIGKGALEPVRSEEAQETASDVEGELVRPGESLLQCSLVMSRVPSPNDFDCQAAPDPGTCEGTLPWIAKAKCSSNCRSTLHRDAGGVINVQCGRLKFCKWNSALGRCGPGDEAAVSTPIRDACYDALSKMKPEQYCEMQK